EIRSYMKNDVRGEVFSFVLVDDSAEMRVSVFGKDLRSIWEVCNTSDAVRIAGGMVKTSDPRYNSTNNPMESVGDILSIRRAKVQEYSGAVVLGCTCSEVRLNSDDTEVTTLTDWYTNAKQSDTEFQPLGAPCPSGAVGGSSDQRGSNRRVVMQLPVSHESFRDLDEIVLDFGEGIKKLYRLVPSGESQFESTRIDWSTQADETSRMSCEDFSGSSRNQ
uniref:REPA_OB_2 domain-containing protein n=1 Tax=Macrostomum lignano TaxID=282301 RepID=A0A1I8G1W7_9PLAT